MAKAIDTAYRGYLFRSRLEARWAVFFDQLHIPYRYEPEGFDLDGLWYLPDFWLPQQDIWIEIKPEEPTHEETEKVRRLAVVTGKHAYIFFGEIPLPETGNLGWDLGQDSAHVLFGDVGHWDCAHWWCVCEQCGLLGVQFNGRAERLPCQCVDANAIRSFTADHPRLLTAYRAARSARFEAPT